MAIKLGDLYVHLSARNTEFGRGMANAGAMVSKFAMQVKAAGQAVGGLGMMMTMAMAGALMKAAAHSSSVAKGLEGLKQSSAALAVQVAQALMPAVSALADAFGRIAGFLQRLDPDLKRQIGTWAAVAAATFLAVGAFSKVMGVVGVFGKIIQGVGMLLSSGLLVPMIAVIGIVAGVITIVGLLSQAWDEFGDTITSVLKGVWDKVRTVFSRIAEVIGTALTYIRDATVEMLRAVGMDKVADALMDPSGVFSKLKSFASAIVDFGVETGRSLKSGFLRGLETLGIDSIIGKVKSALGSVLSGPAAAGLGGPQLTQLRNGAIVNAALGTSTQSGAINANMHMERVQQVQNRIGSTVSGPMRSSPMALIEAQERLANSASNAAQALQSDLMPKFGRLGDIIAAAKGPVATSVADVAQAAGAGSAAGPIGALIGVLVAFITESQPFVEVVAMVGAVVQTLADALGGILTPVSTLIAALIPIASALGELVAPIFLVVEIVAGALIPPLIAFGEMLRAFAPLIKMIVTLHMAPVIAALSQFLPQLQILFDVFRIVGVGILELTRTFAPIWNGIISTVSGILRDIAKLSFKVGEMVFAPFGALGGLADSLDKTTVSVEGIQAQIDTLNSLSWQEAQAKAESIKATTLQTEAVQKATAAMLNVPTGFNVAFERWKTLMQSQNGTTGSDPFIKGTTKKKAALGGLFKKATTLEVAEGGEVEAVAPLSSLAKFVREAVRMEIGQGAGSVVININGANKSAEQIAREVKLIFERETFRKGRGRLGLTTG